jgi:hypothetical protein
LSSILEYPDAHSHEPSEEEMAMAHPGTPFCTKSVSNFFISPAFEKTASGDRFCSQDDAGKSCTYLEQEDMIKDKMIMRETPGFMVFVYVS